MDSEKKQALLAEWVAKQLPSCIARFEESPSIVEINIDQDEFSLRAHMHKGTLVVTSEFVR